MGVLVNRTELAAAFGVSLPTVDRWNERDCPAVEKGGQGKAWVYDLTAVKAWRLADLEAEEAELAAKRAAIEALQAQLDLRQAEEDTGSLPLKLQEQFYRVDKAREERDRARGFLVESAAVRHEFDRVFAYLADRLQTLPDELERRCGLDAATVDKLIEVIDQWQDELARGLKRKELNEPGVRAA